MSALGGRKLNFPVFGSLRVGKFGKFGKFLNLPSLPGKFGKFGRLSYLEGILSIARDQFFKLFKLPGESSRGLRFQCR